MHHIIYIPREHITGITVEEHLTSVGLADHVQGAQTTHANDGGPDGKGGELFGWSNRLHFNAAEQGWTPAVVSGDRPAGRYWVGTFKASPPTEADLRRPGTLYGDDVTLGDGKPWMVPAPAFLPHDMMLGDDGSIRFEPKRRYQAVCIEASRWRNKLRANENQKVAYADLWSFCLQCLSLNYRLPQEVASSLRLIDTHNVKSVIYTALKSED